ncbi:LHFPL tetraspan subfamily member 6 protein [Lingula anatina]|uniref:LHFPL tetraspan subfamily member 6 protein n=1 Tax=Lingula anatina TaxID=7574 RepID=A0A1S3HWR1_LINAN|nr:LHFPL tetraspan subfamily member 6 protein [Lingula anatina]XP_013389500.1 LHFPL tetraspan subfamily member 6 protein [Lingula anatina]|eukprot:XP_013389499.1 LHFPL tetraspan subfamily member 6 protein [Lingula anatina]
MVDKYNYYKNKLDPMKYRAGRQSMGTSLTGVGYLWAFLSMISMGLSATGFYLPFWLQGTMPGVENNRTSILVTFGPFRRCTYPRIDPDTQALQIIEECGRYTTFTDIPSFSWQLVTILVGTGCALSMLVAFTAMFSCCVRDVISQTLARVGGGLQLIAGLLIGGGCVLYPNGWNSWEVQQACGGLSAAYQIGTCSFSWAYYLTIAGAATSILCTCLSCHASKEKYYGSYGM